MTEEDLTKLREYQQHLEAIAATHHRDALNLRKIIQGRTSLMTKIMSQLADQYDHPDLALDHLRALDRLVPIADIEAVTRALNTLIKIERISLCMNSYLDLNAALAAIESAGYRGVSKEELRRIKTHGKMSETTMRNL